MELEIIKEGDEQNPNRMRRKTSKNSTFKSNNQTVERRKIYIHKYRYLKGDS